MDTVYAVKERRIGIDIELKKELVNLYGEREIVDYYPEADDIVNVSIWGKSSLRDHEAYVDGNVLRLSWTPTWKGTHTIEVRVISYNGQKLRAIIPAFCQVVSYLNLPEGAKADRLLKLTMLLKK